MKTYYDSHQGLFSLVSERQKLWREMLELEEKQKDPQRLLKAKGAQLLNEEKAKKRINKVGLDFLSMVQNLNAFYRCRSCPKSRTDFNARWPDSSKRTESTSSLVGCLMKSSWSTR